MARNVAYAELEQKRKVGWESQAVGGAEVADGVEGEVQAEASETSMVRNGLKVHQVINDLTPAMVSKNIEVCMRTEMLEANDGITGSRIDEQWIQWKRLSKL